MGGGARDREAEANELTSWRRDRDALTRECRPSRAALLVEAPFKPGDDTNRRLCLGRMDRLAAVVAGTAIPKSHDAANGTINRELARSGQ
jgi:hypothetical protein